MGAESSSLSNVESLSETLRQVEDSLVRLEDIEQHHERQITNDCTMSIGGKVIVCRSSVRLIVGPVIGTVGCNFAKVLIETDRDADITFNIFKVSSDFPKRMRFIYSICLKSSSDIPVMAVLNNLCSNSTYYVYMGGVNSSDSLKHFAHFQTFPDSSDFSSIMCVYSTEVDSTESPISTVWNVVDAKIDSSNDISDDSPLLLLIHLGNFVSIEKLIQSRIENILDCVTRDDCEMSLNKILSEFETALKRLYREAFRSSRVCNVVSRCGCIFLAGENECGLKYFSTFSEESKKIAKLPLRKLFQLTITTMQLLCRKINWSYMRQLWDDNFKALNDWNLNLEHLTRSMLSLNRSLCTKLSPAMVGQNVMDEGIINLHIQLNALALQSAAHSAESPRNFNFGIVVIGSVCFFIMDLLWNVKFESVSSLTNRIEISSEAFEETVQILNVQSTVSSVVCFSALQLFLSPDLDMKLYNLIPTSFSLLASHSQAKQIQYLETDIISFLVVLGDWQSKCDNNIVTFVQPSNTGKKGKILCSFCNKYSSDAEKRKDMNLICVGEFVELHNKKCGTFDDDILMECERNVCDGRFKFTSVIEENFDRCAQSCWEWKFSSQYGSKGVWKCNLFSSSNESLNFVFGPVVLFSSDNAIIIVLEVKRSCCVQLICVDQISGAEYSSVRSLHSESPTLFPFKNLPLNCAYDVIVGNSTNREIIATFTLGNIFGMPFANSQAFDKLSHFFVIGSSILFEPVIDWKRLIEVIEDVSKSSSDGVNLKIIVKEAYKLKWAEFQNILGCRVNVIVSSLYCDVCILRQLVGAGGTFSALPFCFEDLKTILCDVYKEYQSFATERSVFRELSGFPPYVYFYSANSVVLFQLLPSIISTTENGLISQEQLYYLSKLLSSAVANNFQSLVVLSPIPFISLSSTDLSVGYSSSEILSVLDILSGWVEADHTTRLVNVICKSMGYGFSTVVNVSCVVEGVRLNFVFNQKCLGGMVGSQSVAPPCEVLSSGHRNYSFEHRLQDMHITSFDLFMRNSNSLKWSNGVTQRLVLLKEYLSVCYDVGAHVTVSPKFQPTESLNCAIGKIKSAIANIFLREKSVTKFCFCLLLKEKSLDNLLGSPIWFHHIVTWLLSRFSRHHVVLLTRPSTLVIHLVWRQLVTVDIKYVEIKSWLLSDFGIFCTFFEICFATQLMAEIVSILS